MSVQLLLATGWLVAVTATSECVKISPSDCSQAIDKSGCGQVIADAVASCSQQGGGTVRLSAGVFRFGAAAPEQAWNVSKGGNDVSWYVQIQGANNVQLLGSLDADGAASTFVVLTGLINFARILDTTQFTLGNIVLDMDRPNYSYGQLISCVHDGCDFLVNSTEYPFETFHKPVFESLLEVTSMHSFDPITWRVGPDNDTKELYSSGKITSLRPSEVGSGDMVVVSVRQLAAGDVKKLNASQGYHFILRHRDGHLGRELGRGDHQIAGRNNTQLLQENITSYLAPSMFNVIASSDVVMRRVHLKRHDGTTASWSTSAGIRRPKSGSVDCLGTPDARKSVLIEDCLCDGQGANNTFTVCFNFCLANPLLLSHQPSLTPIPILSHSRTNPLFSPNTSPR
jgi:hypothetical protein